MKKRVLLVAGLLLLSVCGGAVQQRHELFRRAAKLPAFSAAGGVEREAWVAMRDGVRLHTEIYLPEGVTRAPAVLVRNPYLLLKQLERLQCQALTRYGYACVLQDVRGQMDSEGEWEPILHERDDGLDALAWLVAQPFVDGNVAMRGPSYLSCTQLAVADALPPEVKTLVPQVFGTDLRKVFLERGLFRHDVLTAWATLMPARGMRELAASDYLSAAGHRPFVEADERFMTRRLPWFRDVQAATSPASPYWATPQMEAFRGTVERARVPMLFIGAFFDPFFLAQRDAWERLATRDQSVFVIGPWNHLNLTSGDLSFEGVPGRLDTWPLLLEWFEHTLKGKPLVTLEPGVVRTWGVGDVAFRAQPRWPPQGVRPTVLELGAAARANDCAGGDLSPTPTPAEAVSYVFDPADPTPTRGGASLLSFAFFRSLGVTPGPVDQGDSCRRADVLTFRSAPTAAAARLSGAARLQLTVSSTAPDTAFVARLIAEQDGKALLVRENAATLAYPTGDDLEPRTTPPGREVTLSIDFWPIEWVLPAGARWRVDVTSSSFPALHVHANRVDRPWNLETAPVPATQTVYLGEGRAQLELPLVAPD